MLKSENQPQAWFFTYTTVIIIFLSEQETFFNLFIVLLTDEEIGNVIISESKYLTR